MEKTIEPPDGIFVHIARDSLRYDNDAHYHLQMLSPESALG